jgi:hypothetical protein
VGNTFAPNERDVRASNGVRVRGELESGIADEDEPKIVSIDVLEEHGAETRHERTMSKARRLTHDQDSANQLQLLAGDVHPQQLVGCHQRWHVRNVGGLGGHDNEQPHAVNERSTTTVDLRPQEKRSRCGRGRPLGAARLPFEIEEAALARRGRRRGAREGRIEDQKWLE